MNLIIDSGNSFTKLALFDDNGLHQASKHSKSESVNAITTLLKNEVIKRAIVAETADLSPQIIALLQKEVFLLRLDHRTKLPFTNLYTSPETLGADRIALAAAANYFYPGHNNLVIDLGTCITYDFIDDQKKYRGGAISPGVSMRYKSMSQFTQNLPALSIPEDAPLQAIEKTTPSNMHSGVIWGVSFEIDGYIRQLSTQYKNLNVVLTGGDAKEFVNRVKNTIFAPSHFLMNGLNQILEYNCLDE